MSRQPTVFKIDLAQLRERAERDIARSEAGEWMGGEIGYARATLTLIEAAEAAQGLIEDTLKGGSQTLRLEECGDSSCDYDSCRLARALAQINFGEQR